MNNDYKIQLLKIAEKDLLSSRLLYDNHLYLQSIYMFQQGIEKMVKNYGLLFGVVTIVDLRNIIKHSPIKLFEIFLDSQNNAIEHLGHASKDKIIGRAKFFQDFAVSETIEGFHKAKTEIHKLKKIEVQKNKSLIIDIFNKLLDAWSTFEKIKNTNISTEFIKNSLDQGMNYSRDLFSRFSPFNANITSLKIDYFTSKEMKNRKILSIMKKSMKISLLSTQIAQALSLFSVLVIKLDTRLRYPAEKNNEELFSNFNKKDAFIRMLPCFIDLLQLTHKNLKKLNYLLPSSNSSTN